MSKMFRGNNNPSSNYELPVESVVRVKKVERIEANNLVSKPKPSQTKVTRSLTVSVVRVGDVDEMPDDSHSSFVSVPIAAHT
ncbi:uncharacterized protein LOC100275155 [Zea mays]|jgi:hypothetical protein|uniref:Uncharacterized protein n=2 Tax=Zea mays TaxID=4577 RepID=B6SP73_MAIZE|nr:uncharacterized protein LOC100275155 [Zea mays]ACG26656.1 hypothetical protein [Zea mays]AQK42037.1 hypothetical protein ZEAMMB73_Zm00001d024802 [Zea mays]|eukprot:XP_008662946.1 uncharacterized protein LOC100275155 [Zea mays]